MDYAKEPNRITWVLKREKLSKLWLEKEMGKQKKDQREATQRKRPQAKEGRQPLEAGKGKEKSCP